MSTKKIKNRITQIIEELSEGLYEREEVIAVSFLAALAGQNSFLLGPPGTAKSLISRRIACAFKDPNYFECLMNRFSTPEEVFGPISIKALKDDKYTRKIHGYLANADFAFLDEIWKSSPAILNTLLTLINERLFQNGDESIKVPLKALISASNETPPSGQGLEAIYDRFLVRLMVPTMREKSNFETLLKQKPTNPKIELSGDLVITEDEWKGWLTSTHQVELSEETILIIGLIRLKLDEIQEDHPVYISDRRWQRAAMFMKAAAFFCGRKTTNHSDALLLRHCLWSEEENREVVVGIVENAVRESGLKTETHFSELDREKEELDQEINEELFYSNDVYQRHRIGGGKEYFKAIETIPSHYRNKEERTFYIDFDRYKTKEDFHPVDRNGNAQEDLNCNFEGQGTCQIQYLESHNNWEKLTTFSPKIIYQKGDRKSDVNDRLIKSLADSVKELAKTLTIELKRLQKASKAYLATMDSPFVSGETANIAIDGIFTQIEDLKIRIKDCERLMSLCADPSTPKKSIEKLSSQKKDEQTNKALSDSLEYFTISTRTKGPHIPEEMRTCYVHVSKFETSGWFKPVDRNKNEIVDLRCDFRGTDACHLEARDSFGGWHAQHKIHFSMQSQTIKL